MKKKDQPKRTGRPPRDRAPIGETDGLAFVDVGYVWTPREEFPAFLRASREAANLGLRTAAKALGISHVLLSRLETGGPARSPNVRRLFAMADLYGVDRREMLKQAGIASNLPPEVEAEAGVADRFAALVLHPDLKPSLMTDEALLWIPTRLKQQWIEFAQRLADQPDPKAVLNRILDGEAR